MRAFLAATLWILPSLLIGFLLVRILSHEGIGRLETPSAEWAGREFPRTIAIEGEEPVSILHAPRRIVLANTSVVDMATALVSPDRIAALCVQAFEWSRLALDPEGYRGHPTFRTFLTETVLAHDGDLVLCTPFNIPETLSTLRELGIPIVRFQDPTDLAGVFLNLRLMARALGAEERLQELEADLERRIARLSRGREARSGLRALFYSNFGGSGFASGAGTLSHEAIRLTGMRDAGAEAGLRGTQSFSFEELIALDPDVLVVGRPTADEPTSTEITLRETAALSDLRAVRENAIFALHPALHTTTSQEIVTAAEEIARQVDAWRGGE